MRLLSKIRNVMVFAMATMSLQSCLKDDGYDYSVMWPNALVTVKTDTDNDNKLFLQLDDETTLLPVNLTESPYDGKEVRALVNYSEVEEPSDIYSKAVHINWIDSILTKDLIIPEGTEEEINEKYGNDPVEILRNWVTIAEDGYLTLRFSTVWSGNPSAKHFVNLLVVNKENYEVEFRHNAFDDTYGHMGDAIVAFKLDDILPDTKGKTVKLKLKWKSFTEEKVHEFDYCSRKSTETSPALTKTRASNFIK